MSRGKQHTVATGVVEMCNGVNSIVVAVGESDWESDESPVFRVLTACVCMLSGLPTWQQILESS